MQNDSVMAVSLALGVLTDAKATQQSRRRAALTIQKLVMKANDGLYQAAEILAAVAMGECGPSIQREANDWLKGGGN